MLIHKTFNDTKIKLDFSMFIWYNWKDELAIKCCIYIEYCPQVGACPVQTV